jgi:hypothetical protein
MIGLITTPKPSYVWMGECRGLSLAPHSQLDINLSPHLQRIVSIVKRFLSQTYAPRKTNQLIFIQCFPFKASDMRIFLSLFACGFVDCDNEKVLSDEFPFDGGEEEKS